MVLVMLLAMTLAWAGHVISAIAGQAEAQPFGMMHEHPHAEEAAESPFEAVFPDHGHDRSTPDHLHETPHLAPVVSLPPAPVQRSLRTSLASGRPSAPVALIERPPRPSAGA